MTSGTPGKSGYAARLPLWVLTGAVLGIFVGLFFGGGAAVLRPVGTTYVKLMEIVVFPYIICSLLHGLGRLAPDTAWRLFRCSWHIYLALWGATFLLIFLLSLAIPPAPAPSFVDGRLPQESLGLIDLLIPANPFFDLASNHLPAIVVFSIVYGVAIQRIENKAGFLAFVDLIRAASVTIWHWVVLLAPFGVFALFADTAGTLEAQALADLSLYLFAMLFGTLVLAFWILPSLISALCPMSTREVLRDLQGALVIAVVTSLSVAALPFVQQAAEKLAKRAGIDDENSGEIIRTTLAVSYPLAQLGNFFIWLFVVFAAFYFRVPLSAADQLALPFVTLLSGFGSPTSSVDAVAFLSAWLGLPDDANNLYVGMMTITRYGQVVASVMGFAFVGFLVTMTYYGKIRLRVPRMGLALLVSVAVVAAGTVAGRQVQNRLVETDTSPYLAYRLVPDITKGIKVEFEKLEEPGSENGDAKAAAPSDKPILERIQSSGELRVGFNPHIIPFSYRNSGGELVGFDIAYAYKLARDLNVRLRMIPFTWNGFAQDLAERRFDLALSGIYVTNERLQRFAISEPYFQSPVALIVRAAAVSQFLSRSAIEARPGLTFAVFDDPVMIDLVKRLFPKVRVVVLPSYDALPSHPEVDAALWTLEQAKTWAPPRQDYTAVVPKDLGAQFLIAYLMPADALQFSEFIDNWLRLQRASGFHERMVRQWIEGRPDLKATPRWSILKDVLGWQNDEPSPAPP
jgi:Na+/H+-dicarboxylate symporter